MLMENQNWLNTVDFSYWVLNYLRQANEVNGRDNTFVRCVSVCVCAAAGHGS